MISHFFSFLFPLSSGWFPWCLDSPVQEVRRTWVVSFSSPALSLPFSLADSPVQEVLPRDALLSLLLTSSCEMVDRLSSLPALLSLVPLPFCLIPLSHIVPGS